MNHQSIAATYPLSPLQQGMLFHTVVAPQSGVDIEQIICTLPEPLNIPVLQWAWQCVIRRHDILRTSFRWDSLEQPLQDVHFEVDCPFEIFDWRELAEDTQEVQLNSFLQADRTRGFDLGRPPLMRLTLFHYAANNFRLVWTFHHILLDGRSFPLLLNEVFAFYEAHLQQQELQLDRPRPYRDYIEWLQQQDLSAAKKFWQQLLAGFYSPTPLMVTKTSTAKKKTGEYRVQHRHLSSTLTASLQLWAQQNQLTLNTLVQAAWALLLGRYSDKTEVVFGATRAGRRLALAGAGTDSMVGLFINTLPVRVHLPPNASVLHCLREIRAQSVAVREFEHTPLVQIQHWSDVPQGLPLFDSLLVFENYQLSTVLQAQGGKWQNRHFRVLEQTNYPLTLAVYGGNNLLLRLEYDTGRFTDDTIGRMLGHLETLMQGFVDNPTRLISDVPLLSEDERHQILVAWNNTSADYSRTKCFHHLFEEQVARTPHHVAVVCDDERLTYEQLNRQANQLARYLQTLGVGPEVVVGVYLERSLEMVVGLLGILKAGGAYLPLNLANPPERLAFMLKDAGVSVLLSQNRLLQTGNLGHKLGEHVKQILPLDSEWERVAQFDNSTPPSPANADNLVYVIYTSGSTGQPKGVMISHRGLVNYLSWCSKAYAVAEGRGSLLHSSLGFDLTVTALFSPLLVGKSVELIPENGDDQSAEAFRLPDALRKGHDFSLVKITPAHLEILNQQISPQAAVGRTRRFIIGGETLRGDSIAFWQAHAPATKLVNEYGPTETVVGCCIYEVPAGAVISGDVPIGRPIANTQLYILDGNLHPVPVGVPGELYIGGDGVARGYLNRPALTAERFVPNPFGREPGARLYRSGDLARYLPDGVIEFLGRIDHQVKIRGFRIELGEIEALLSRHPAVQEVVVTAREDVPGQKRLVAYVVPQQDEALTLDEIRHYLQPQLPDYMLPSALVLLELLPLTANGKVDRPALPVPDTTRLLAETYTPPQTGVEQVLAGIWAALLGVDRVGIHDDFFELGGDSIISLQIVARAGQAGIRLTPRQVFQHRTIAELALVAGNTPIVVAEQDTVTGPVALTPVQHWFFEQNLSEPHHWNQTILLETQQPLRPAVLEQVLVHLLSHHDALRMRFVPTANGWQQFNADSDEAVSFIRIDLHDVPAAEQEAVFKTKATELQADLNLSDGPLMRMALFELGASKPNYVLIVIHHLVVDGVSWRILLEDFETIYQQLDRGESVKLPPKTTSFKQWATRLADYARLSLPQRERDYWLNRFGKQIAALPVDYPAGKSANTQASVQVVSVSLDERETQTLLHDVPPVYHTEINDVLLTALAQVFTGWAGRQSVLVDLEGHGREDIVTGIDLSRTVGWFTTIFPVHLALNEVTHPGEALKLIKEQLRQIPNKGLGYGVLRYLRQDGPAQKLQKLPQAEVSFNYLGQFDQMFSQNTLLKAGCESGLFGLDCELAGPSRSLQGHRVYLLEINGSIAGNKLRLDWAYSVNIHQKSTIETLAQNFLRALRALIAHCQSPVAGGYTPSDFPEAELSQQELDDLVAELQGLME
jgi:amino acid adenylation domain-containing protein/non-ribosomal peptide synthase protein (TIGR01720 family)